MNWPHTVHNTRESPRYIFTIIIFKFKKFILFYIFWLFLSPHYSFNFHFYNLLLSCKIKRKTLFLKQMSYIYIFYNFCDLCFVCLLVFWFLFFGRFFCLVGFGFGFWLLLFFLILYFWESNLYSRFFNQASDLAGLIALSPFWHSF